MWEPGVRERWLGPLREADNGRSAINGLYGFFYQNQNVLVSMASMEEVFGLANTTMETYIVELRHMMKGSGRQLFSWDNHKAVFSSSENTREAILLPPQIAHHEGPGSEVLRDLFTLTRKRDSVLFTSGFTENETKMAGTIALNNNKLVEYPALIIAVWGRETYINLLSDNNGHDQMVKSLTVTASRMNAVLKQKNATYRLVCEPTYGYRIDH